MDGMVFDIQRLSVHDGPGIRTTVFLKGCPLHCVWCHNPESNAVEPELAFHENLCIGCGACFSICPRQCHTLKNETHEIDRTKCIRCGLCVQVCIGALKMIGKRYTVDEVMKEVLKDVNFYETSGGGITISGGEPLMQPDFTYHILLASKEAGLHTCLETSGYASSEVISRIASVVDLFLYDIKETDPERHLEYVGIDQKQIMENLFLIDDTGIPSILRCPIIPGINDRKTHFDSIAALANQLNHVQMVHVEPYNNFGEGKSKSIGKEYLLKGLEPPTDEQITHWVESIQSKTKIPVIKS